MATDFDKSVKEFRKKEDERKKWIPVLDRQGAKIQLLDDRIKALEEEKRIELLAMGELFDSAMVYSHSLRNGFHIKPDDRRKIHITSTGEFLGWLKQNKKPTEVLDFFDDALKIVNLKRFCEKEYNIQREAGEMVPKIDGIEFGEQTYTRLTTGYKKVR